LFDAVNPSGIHVELINHARQRMLERRCLEQRFSFLNFKFYLQEEKQNRKQGSKEKKCLIMKANFVAFSCMQVPSVILLFCYRSLCWFVDLVACALAQTACFCSGVSFLNDSFLIVGTLFWIQRTYPAGGGRAACALNQSEALVIDAGIS